MNVGNEASSLYSITDGGNLENTGSFPSSAASTPFIIAFFNSTFPSALREASAKIAQRRERRRAR